MTTDNSSAEPGNEPDISYTDAIAELETILGDLEGDAVDVDVLGVKVERAATLVQVCRERIGTARVHVERIVAELEELEPEP